MRIISLALVCLSCAVQAQVSIDFESEDLSRWEFSDSSRWGIDKSNPISGAASLHHIYDNSESGEDMAGIAIGNLHADIGQVTWQVKVKYGYSPSASNRWALFLLSDASPDKMKPDGDVNGFAIGVNITGYDDTLRIWKFRDGDAEKILSTTLNWQSDIGVDSIVNLQVERSISGVWSVFIKDRDNTITQIGQDIEPDLFDCGYFGVYYNYTSTRDRLFWLDDISIDGIFITDTTSPSIIDAEFLSNSCMILSLDEQPEPGVVSPTNFTLYPGELVPESVVLKNKKSIILRFPGSLKNKEIYRLYINSLCDGQENCADSLSVSRLLAWPEWGDIVFTEIMSDPSPGVNLPPFEYIELYNRSHYSLNLRSLQITNGSISRPLPDFILNSGAYVLLTDEEYIDQFADLENKTGIYELQQLNNVNDYIVLSDTLSFTIHGVDYHINKFNSILKKNGGWSLEMIDINYPFDWSSNWGYSVSRDGGTPGIVNSIAGINHDNTNPEILNIYPQTSGSLTLDFSEPVNDITETINAIQIESLDIISISKSDSLRRSFTISLGRELERGEIYTASFDNIFDYGGNMLKQNWFQFGLSEVPEANDIVINELLYDPLPWENEYIEFYNRSDKIIDASSVLLTTVRLETGDTSLVSIISEEYRSILPQTYYAITESKDAITERYFNSTPECIFEVGNIPSFPDNSGSILLFYKDLNLLDQLNYSDDLHLDIISSTEGVSLERVDPDKNTSLRSNWHSASGLSGWGTPGQINSVYINPEFSEHSKVNLSSRQITPDGDGFEDILAVDLNLGEETWIINATIFDDQGYPVRMILENSTGTGNERLFWDGTGDNGGLLSQGIYIVFIHSVSGKGEVFSWKGVCAILLR